MLVTQESIAAQIPLNTSYKAIYLLLKTVWQKLGERPVFQMSSVIQR